MNTENVKNMQNEEKSFDWQKVWFIFTLHWKQIAIIFGAFVVIGLGYCFLKTPVYTSSSTIKVQLREAESSVLSRLQISYFLGQTGRNIRDEVAILQSRQSIQQAVEQLYLQASVLQKKGLRWVELYGDDAPLIAKYTPSDDDNGQITVMITPQEAGYKMDLSGVGIKEHYLVDDLDTTLTGTWGTLVLQSRQPVTKNTKVVLHDMERLISFYTRSISIVPINNSNLISITMTSPHPQRDCDLMQQLIENYQAISLHEKERLTENVCSFIDKRLQSIAAELDSSENNIEQYRVKNKITDLTTETGIYLEVSEDYQKNLVKIESQLNIVDFMFQFVTDENKSNEMLLPINLGIEDENGTLATLLEEYNELILQKVRLQRTATENNPVLVDLTQQIELIRKNIINCLSCIKESLSIAKNDLDRKNTQLSQRLNNIPTYERHYLDKQRRQEVQEELFLFLYQKREESAMMLSSTVSQNQVIDTPKTDPLTKAPKKSITLALFALLGLFLPTCCLFIYYTLLNQKIIDIDDCQKRLQTPLGGIVYHNKTSNILLPNAPQFEDFRRLREFIHFTLKDKAEKSRVVLVSSLNKGEGKNYIATHTALAYAARNKKTVLVDLDAQTNHAYSFELSQQVDVLSARDLSVGIGDLFTYEHLQKLFAELKEKYEMIIVVAPSLSEASETFYLNDFIDLTLFVVRFNYSPNSVIDSINGLHRSNRLKNITCVINDVYAGYTDNFYGLLK